MSWWDIKSENYYKIMLRRHPQLWEFLQTFIKDNKIESILEVGGGYTWIPRYGIKEYVGIDVNETANKVNRDRYPNFKFITADFGDILPFEYQGKFDAVMALAVIEHTPKWREFLTNIAEIKPKYAVISFFNGLDHIKTAIRRYKIRKMPTCYINRYAQKDIEDFLEGLGIGKDKYEIFDIDKKDAKKHYESLLVIKFNGGE